MSKSNKDLEAQKEWGAFSYEYTYGPRLLPQQKEKRQEASFLRNVESIGTPQRVNEVVFADTAEEARQLLNEFFEENFDAMLFKLAPMSSDLDKKDNISSLIVIGGKEG